MKIKTFNIQLSDYSYELPRERIAQHPLEQRDRSKLLVYRQEKIHHTRFFQLPELLTDSSFLFFNNTRVINARLFFQRQTGANIQIFLLEGVDPSPVQLALQSTTTCVWECMIGNRKKWKKGEKLHLHLPGQDMVLTASWADYDRSWVRFDWEKPGLNFAQVIEAAGKIPLPPYIEREATDVDQLQYQTIYSKEEGAVAAPTAGLHFTNQVFERLEEKGIKKDFVTLHVGAGTFLPIKEARIQDHDMHSEQIIITKANLDNLLNNEGKIIAVGTTSLRVLESLYWLGVKMIKEGSPILDFKIDKLSPYRWEENELPDFTSVFSHLKNRMEEEKRSVIYGKTEIFIFPGYTFRVCRGLITNFHMPKSTLILLIAAFVGPHWRKIYQEALEKNYRFLSYGDSSLLLP